MNALPFIKWFADINIDDVALVGGKNASLGEMVRELSGQGVKVPNGFAITAEAYRHFIREAGIDAHTIEEGLKVQAEMETHGLKRGQDALELYVMCEVPSNVILANEFADIFDGFSIGSNDLTQLILGVDRDSAIVASIFDERNAAVKNMIAQVIATCRARGRKIGICGQAPSDYPEFAQFLVEQGIDSISLNPDSVLKTTLAILDCEARLQSHPAGDSHVQATPGPG